MSRIGSAHGGVSRMVQVPGQTRTWPTWPNGQPKRFGDLTAADRQYFVDQACLRIQRELSDPLFRAAVGRALAEEGEETERENSNKT